MFNIILLGLTSFLTDVSSEMVYPLLPLYLTMRLGAGPAIVGIIEGIAESLASILKVFSGVISDKIGKRKPLTIAGYSGSTIGKLFLYLSTSWHWVLWGRIIDRLGKGIRTAPRDALIADSSNPEWRGKAFGLHRTLDTLGAIVGVILAYYFLTSYKGDYTAVFLFSLIPAFFGVAVLFFVKEKSDAMVKNTKKISLRWSRLDRRLKAFLIVTFIFTLGNSSNQFLLLRAKDIGFDAKTVILLYLIYNIVYSILSYPAGKLSDKIGRKTLLVGGYLFYGIVYFGFAMSSQQYHIWTLFALYGVYIAMTEGVEKALVSDLAPDELRATLIGLHATLVGIGLFPASFLAGMLWKFIGASAPFYFGGLMGLFGSLGLLLVL